MSKNPTFLLTAFLMVAGAMAGEALGQDQQQLRAAGTFNDYVWVEVGSGAGAWHVTGEWTAQVKGDSGKGEFIASLLGVRSDLWVLQTNANPANPALRSPHTHHVALFDALVSAIPDGVRLTGTAIITTNGAVAPFSGSPVQVDITGGGVVRFSKYQADIPGSRH